MGERGSEERREKERRGKRGEGEETEEHTWAEKPLYQSRGN